MESGRGRQGRPGDFRLGDFGKDLGLGYGDRFGRLLFQISATIINASAHRYRMQRYPQFSTWLESRRHGPHGQRVDQIAARILAAGAAGISYSDLISRANLARDIVDALLNNMLDLGIVNATGSGLERRFFYCCRVRLGI
jgi:hypothetical protein